MRTILHTEASTGWGGQEIRTLREAIGMRERGHTLLFAVAKGAQLAKKAREQNFTVYEIPLKISQFYKAIPALIRIIRKHNVDTLNTHSSADAWLGGIAARLTRRSVIRTRHISAPIKPGLNSRLLYRTLADAVVTTCQNVADIIQHQASLRAERCQSIPTGIHPDEHPRNAEAAQQFRRKYGINPHDTLIGTICVLRSWKGIPDFIKAASLLEHEPHLKWIIVGSGPCEKLYREAVAKYQLQEHVIFTGHLANPNTAFEALDIFCLLSTANEGVSQASLQAAFYGKPLVTTPTGGLCEVCLKDETGIPVPIHSPEKVRTAIAALAASKELREKYGRGAEALVKKHFLFSQTLDQMEKVYEQLT